ncbi:hypothetical protein BDR07DRAFT_594590 [Suillus spraguei]|nr:hypothetical protein BDR07DRAFT_594590 [Suillus spraguei]
MNERISEGKEISIPRVAATKRDGISVVEDKWCKGPGKSECQQWPRFVSVTDRFLCELEPVTKGQVAKDLDTKYKHLVKGLCHVWPPEAFEEGAEFLELSAKSFANAHGLRFKIAFADTLTRLLHPIGKAIERIYS